MVLYPHAQTETIETAAYFSAKHRISTHFMVLNHSPNVAVLQSFSGPEKTTAARKTQSIDLLLLIHQ